MEENDSNDAFESVDEIWEKFFPRAWHEDEVESAPQAFGAKLAARVVEILEQELKK